MPNWPTQRGADSKSFQASSCSPLDHARLSLAHELTLSGHAGGVASLAVQVTRTRIVSAGHDTTLRMWDLGAGEALGEPLAGHIDAVTSVAVTPDGTRIVSGSFDRTVRVWDLATGAPWASPSPATPAGSPPWPSPQVAPGSSAVASTEPSACGTASPALPWANLSPATPAELPPWSSPPTE
jgi:WD40 repeat protein